MIGELGSPTTVCDCRASHLHLQLVFVCGLSGSGSVCRVSSQVVMPTYASGVVWLAAPC